LDNEEVEDLGGGLLCLTYKGIPLSIEKTTLEALALMGIDGWQALKEKADDHLSELISE